MENSTLRQIIRESIQNYIREIDEAGNVAALEAKIAKTEEAIETRKSKMNLEGIDEAYHEMLDKGKVKELQKEIKHLEKSKAKYENLLEKMKNKGKKKTEEPKSEETKEIVDEMASEVENGMDENYMEEEKPLNESFLYMQKLAGVITEAQYNQKKRLIETQLNELNDAEQELVDAILGESINEGAFDPKVILAKLKTLARKGLLSALMLTSVLSSCNFSPNVEQQIKQEVEQEQMVDSSSVTQAKDTAEYQKVLDSLNSKQPSIQFKQIAKYKQAWENFKKDVKNTNPHIITWKNNKWSDSPGAFNQSLNWGAHAGKDKMAGFSVLFTEGSDFKSGPISISVSKGDNNINSFENLVKNLKKAGFVDPNNDESSYSVKNVTPEQLQTLTQIINNYF